MPDLPVKPLVAIACGGTGGHLFPGMAVAEELVRRRWDVLLLISPKEVDQQAVKSATGMAVATLPAVGLIRGHWLRFAVGFWKSFRAAARLFRERPPQAVLAMGGFTCAPPVLAGRICGAATFLHESNAIPGKANRWLARVVHQAFVGFPVAARRLRSKSVETTGTPVRRGFQPGDAAACRVALSLAPERPVVLIMGGSQGARGINDLGIQALPLIASRAPQTQFLHLTGSEDFEKVDQAYRQHDCKAVVRAFLSEMDLALGATTVAVSRSGASSLAELAAMHVPAILIPYPFAADNHQYYNARWLVESGAALLLEQSSATPQALAEHVLKLLLNANAHAALRQGMGRCHTPRAAELIADRMLAVVKAMGLWQPNDAGVAESHSPLRNPCSALV